MAAIGVALFLLAPLAVYALLVGAISSGIATWVTAIVRPVLLMLLLTPTLVAGHGIAIAPLSLAMGFALFANSPDVDSALPHYLLQWLVMSGLGFGFEALLATWRRRRLSR